MLRNAALKYVGYNNKQLLSSFQSCAKYESCKYYVLLHILINIYLFYLNLQFNKHIKQIKMILEFPRTRSKIAENKEDFTFHRK